MRCPLVMYTVFMFMFTIIKSLKDPEASVLSFHLSHIFSSSLSLFLSYTHKHTKTPAMHRHSQAHKYPATPLHSPIHTTRMYLTTGGTPPARGCRGRGLSTRSFDEPKLLFQYLTQWGYTTATQAWELRRCRDNSVFCAEPRTAPARGGRHVGRYGTPT